MYKLVPGDSGQTITVPSLLKQKLSDIANEKRQKKKENRRGESQDCRIGERDSEKQQKRDGDCYDFILGDSEDLSERVTLLEEQENEEEDFRKEEKTPNSRQQRKIKPLSPDRGKCNSCDSAFNDFAALQRHNTTKKCDVCEKVLKNANTLKAHKRKVHTSNDRVKCDSCDDTFKNAFTMSQHQRSYHGMRALHARGEKVGCGHCHLLFDSQRLLMLHMREVQKSRECPRCPFQNPMASRLRSHMLLVHLEKEVTKDDDGGITKDTLVDEKGLRTINEMTNGSQEDRAAAEQSESKSRTASSLDQAFPQIESSLKCQHCEKKFKTAINLRQHLTLQHGPDEQLPCSECDKRFRNKTSLTSHSKSSHQEVECPHCQLNITRGMLRCHVVWKHLRQVSSKTSKSKSDPKRQARKKVSKRTDLILPSQKCLHCDFTTTKSEIVMRKHLRNIHQQITIFPCQFCGKKFGKKANLKIHVAQMHERDDVTLDDDGKRTFPCKLCWLVCKSRTGLTRHANGTHGVATGPMKEQRTKCLQCDVVKGKHEMKNHVRIVHDKVRDKICQFCGKRFSITANLNVHIGRHHEGEIIVDDEGKRIFPCDLCGQVCHTRWQFTTHRNTKHEKDKDKLDSERNPRLLCCEKCGKSYTGSHGMMKHMSNKHGRDNNYT